MILPQRVPLDSPRHGPVLVAAPAASYPIAGDIRLLPGWHLLAIDLREPCNGAGGEIWIRPDGSGKLRSVALKWSPGARQRLLIRIDSACRLESLSLPCSQRKGRTPTVRVRRLGRAEAFLRLVFPRIPRPLLSMANARRTTHAISWLFRMRSADVSALLGAAFGQASADYEAWLKYWAALTAKTSLELRQHVDSISARPRISVLLPVFNAAEHDLRACLDSVLRQSYTDWELCIADDASTQPHVWQVLSEYAGLDRRIRLVRRERNGHISAASNTALSLATGSFVALLDQDDLLAEDALAWVVAASTEFQSARVFYSDEDKIDANGRRFDPYFKPDFNPELLLGQNMVSHFGVYEKRLLIELGGFREGFEGSQDHDLVLRCLEHVGLGGFCHIPVVLYHWRSGRNSTARSASAKPYALEAAVRAVAEHLQRQGYKAQVRAGGRGWIEVARAVPAPAPSVSVLVPTRDRLDLLAKCIGSIHETTDYSSFRVLVIDNGSREAATLEWLEREQRLGRIDVLRIDEPFNFARLNNRAVEAVRSDIVVLMNNDITVRNARWLDALVSEATCPGVGAIGALLTFPDGTVQHAGVHLGVNGVACHAYSGAPLGAPGQMGRLHLSQRMAAVTAACMAVPRSVYLEVGGMDENLAVAFNDVDFCLRLRKRGYAVVWTPRAVLEHAESASRGPEASAEAQARLLAEEHWLRRTWGSCIAFDPSYNPNLARVGEPYSLSFDHPPPCADLRAALQHVRRQSRAASLPAGS